MKALLARLTPVNLTAIAAAILTLLAASGVTLTLVEQGTVVAFVGAAAIVLLNHRTAESITALVAAAVAVAVAFGLNVTHAQEESILIVAGALAAAVAGKAGVAVVKARKAAPPVSVLSEPSVPGVSEYVWPRVKRAIGIHSHPTFKVGLIPTDPSKPILELDRVLTGITPPATEDRYAGVTFGLDGNDKYGDCGPTSVDNNRRSTSKVATGVQRTAPLDAVLTLYKESGNPNFPKEDNGVEMGAMLDALLKNGIDGDKPVAFGKLTDLSDQALERAVAVFGGVLFAVNLQTSQQAQSEGNTPEWRYVKSGVWGGHAIYCGKYKVTPAGVDAPVISWAKEIGTDDTFRQHQLDEAWVIIWPWHLEHPAFLEGVDLAALAAEYKALTGKELVLPAPAPAPVPGAQPSPADVLLWTYAKDWAVNHRHTGMAKTVADAIRSWAAAGGLK